VFFSKMPGNNKALRTADLRGGGVLILLRVRNTERTVSGSGLFRFLRRADGVVSDVDKFVNNLI
jgi:hypothetical protein